MRNYVASEKLRDKVALIPRGDRGIGLAVAMLFAKEGAGEAVSYFKEDKDARGTKWLVEAQAPKYLLACRYSIEREGAG